MGKKQEVLDRLLADCLARGGMVFDNDKVKEISRQVGFGNPFDVTKVDNRGVMSPEMHRRDYFLVHLGEGRHQFIKGAGLGFHDVEPIPPSAAVRWPYRQSVLNEINTSESNLLSVASNQGVLGHFLYGDNPAGNVNVYCAHRTKKSLAYTVSGMQIRAVNLQVEIDMTSEVNGRVTVMEGKNKFPKEFAVYQIFAPYLYYRKIKEEVRPDIKKIDCCYVLRAEQDGVSVVRMYLYEFDGVEMTSIRLVKCAEYRLAKK